MDNPAPHAALEADSVISSVFILDPAFVYFSARRKIFHTGGACFGSAAAQTRLYLVVRTGKPWKSNNDKKLP
jgi:hypothetical protein